MESRKGKYEEAIKKTQEKIKEMSFLNIIDRNVDQKVKQKEAEYNQKY